MSSPIVPAGAEVAAGTPEARVLALAAEPRWWLWLVTGVIWTIAALVILQFDAASVTTVSVIVGCMFLFSGAQQLVLATLADQLRWLWIVFGVIFVGAGIVCFANPEDTFRGLADVLGFLFLAVGIWWTIESLLVRAEDSLWWLRLASGILMILLAFWTSGQFFIERAYTLLIIAGVWALMQGITDIIRAFQLRRWTAEG
jgi:uncharacterized membrane protein HdeD (DUF308 family)